MELKAERLKLDVVNVALVKEGQPLAKSGESVEKAAKRLARVYLEWVRFGKGRVLVVCDECGGESPDDPERCPCCPFCGSADPIDVPAAEPSAEPGDGAPAPIVVAPPAEVVERDASADERKLDAAVDRVRVFYAEMRGAGWDAGNALREIEEKGLWRARAGEDGKARFSSFDEFVQGELGFTARWARDMVDLAKEFSRDQVLQVGRKKLVPILRLSGDARQGLLERAPEMSARGTPVPTNGKPSRNAALRAKREEILAKDPETRAPEVAKQLGISVSHLARVMKPVARKSLPEAVRHAPIFPRPVEQGAKAEKVAEKKGKPAPRRLTLIALEGRVPVPLWARRKSPKDKRRAQELSDDPRGRLQLLNGTELLLSVRRGKFGLVVDVTVQEVVEG